MADKSQHPKSIPVLKPHPYDMSQIPDSLCDSLAQQQMLYEVQRPMTQRFIETQAQALANTLMTSASQVRFRFPDEVVDGLSGGVTVAVLAESREQTAGGLLDSLTRADLRTRLRHHLLELENSNIPGVAISAGLIRFATASHLVSRMLPSGRAVTYALAADEEIPAIPLGEPGEVGSAITADTDAIVEGNPNSDGRGELQVPFVPAARRFYLPQWVAFDDEGNLLIGSIEEAEGYIASMQHFLSILHMAVGLAPYIVADEEYQRKRYGMLGQLVNQGRALAHYQTAQIIEVIQTRSARGDLNRGLSLSIPYFDDQELVIKLRTFQVTPSGRIMFTPAFVTRAALEEQAKIAQDTRLNPSTRKYLLQQLELLARTFITPSDQERESR